MITTAIFPGRYVQEDRALEVLGEETERLGKHALVLLDSYINEHYDDRIAGILPEKTGFTCTTFNGECCKEEIERIQALAENHCRRNQGTNMTGRQGPQSALTLAELCHESG
ncbi:hypothetical protein [Parendozoicomonas sp. Alg238-R29]|uniref:hypothetical protein n=1 Tax=Parendozoicomonas sp. Alg238-R29 TaxID=2993446 RepID=UPI00248ED609|nr:hypothetical protein [Parendozoicomonas sp. Alg238-R29]